MVKCDVKFYPYIYFKNLNNYYLDLLLKNVLQSTYINVFITEIMYTIHH